MQLPPRFRSSSQWSFIPGPQDQSQPMSSLAIDEIAEIPAEMAAASFLAFPGMRLEHPAEPDWWAWRARWESGTDFIAIDFTLFEEPPGTWGGSSIDADCSASALLALLGHMAERHRGIWLHDPECGMHAHEHLAGG